MDTLKEQKSTGKYNFTNLSIPPLLCNGHHIGVCMGSNDGLNQTCQISAESVQGFRSLMGPKMTLPTDLAHRPYNVRTNSMMNVVEIFGDFRQISRLIEIAVEYYRKKSLFYTSQGITATSYS